MGGVLPPLSPAGAPLPPQSPSVCPQGLPISGLWLFIHSMGLTGLGQGVKEKIKVQKEKLLKASSVTVTLGGLFVYSSEYAEV